MSATRTAIPNNILIEVLTESGYRCACPNCPNELTINVHHIVMVANGGKHTVDNLLPLCPYCHDKHHRGIIKQQSIIEWKRRVKSLYDSTKNEPTIAHVSPATKDGFASAFHMYTNRTFPIYWYYKYEDKTIYYCVGFATFIAERTLLTSKIVIEKIEEYKRQILHGYPVIAMSEYILTFKVMAIYSWGDIVLLESANTKERWCPCPEVVAKCNLNTPFPDETEIEKVAALPYIGQEVGYLFASKDTNKLVSLVSYEFGQSVISHFLRETPVSLDKYALSPAINGMCLYGGPVFLSDGTLVGVITGAIPFADEDDSHQISGWNRPIIGGFWKVDRLKRMAERNSTPEVVPT